MKSVRIRFSEVFPYVRYVQRFLVSDNAYPVFFQAYDNRIFYAAEGSGTIYFKDRSYRLTRGDLIAWTAGVPYRMISDDGSALVLLGANFDFTQQNLHISYPVPPARETAFDPAQLLDGTVFTDDTPFRDIIYLKKMFHLESDFGEMLQEYEVQKLFYAERLESILKSVLCLVSRRAALKPAPDSKTDCAGRMDEIINFIRAHYTEALSNADLGARFNYHPNYLNKLMKMYTGKSLHQYLVSYRISRAVDLLSTTDLSVSEIAERVGFKDLCHFGKIFHARLGITPSAIRDPSVKYSAR